MLRLVSSSALDIDAASLASAARHSSTLAMSGRVVDRERAQAPLLPWVRPRSAGSYARPRSCGGALRPGQPYLLRCRREGFGPMNDFAKDAQDPPAEGGVGTGPGGEGEAATAREVATSNEAGDPARGWDPVEAGPGSGAAAVDERQEAAAAEDRQEIAAEEREDAAAEADTGQHRVPGAPVTGETAVDDALARLGEVGDAPTAEHVEIYDDVHRKLTDTLADVDED